MNIVFPQILFQIINFGIVMGALWYLLYKPVIKIFSERAKRIEEGQKAAQEAIAQQEKIDELKEKTSQQLKIKSAAEMKKAVAEAEEQKALIIDQARAEAKNEVAKLKKDWQEEKQQQMQTVNQRLVEAVIAVSSRVIGKSLTSKQHQQLIDVELKELLKSI